jgi:putative Holliday junction resolvase
MDHGTRYLGVDFGSKRVGLALSDEAGIIAFPLMVLQNSDSLVADITALCREHDVGVIVVGESKNFSQQDNEIMKEIRPFITALQDKITLPIHLHPEFLTSSEAERIQGKNDMHDASAASLILQSYLDTHNNPQP